jgi:hypothetical protein
MTEIPGFWDIGPHDALPIEETWHRFVRSSNGNVVASLLKASPPFENADYLFPDAKVVAELKEVQTEFLATRVSREGFEQLLKRLIREDPQWKPAVFGENGECPSWFQNEFVRLARPPLSRVIKKANRQLRETKRHFGITAATGVLLFVNDGFTGLAPNLVHALACDLLVNSYSSIDCFVYLNVNRYIEIAGSDEPKLIWHPTYSDRADQSLVEFIDALGRRWFDFLDGQIGPRLSRIETQDRTILRGSKAIVLPGENRGQPNRQSGL